MFCPKCGAPVDGASRFCGACGQDLSAYQAHPAGQAQTAAPVQQPYQPPAQQVYQPPAYQPPPYQPPVQQVTVYQQPNQAPGYGQMGYGVMPRIASHMGWAIVSLIFFFWPTGIAAIVNASRVNNRLAIGDIAGAQLASGRAKMWCWISFIIAIVVWVIYIVVWVAILRNTDTGLYY